MYAVIILFVCLCNVGGQDINAMKNMPKYDARYDYLDVDAILENKRLVRNYVDCLISANRCTPEGKALKRLLPEALRTKCVRCTERQKKTAVKVIKRLKFEYPDEWSKLSSRWDPTGDFTRYFEEILDKNHFGNGPATGNEIAGSSLPTSATKTPVVLTVQTTSPNPMEASSPPRPIILNRFGEEGELMIGSSSGSAARPVSTTSRPTTTRPTTTRTIPPRPTQSSWPSDNPTRFPLRPTAEMPLPYTTAITLIDQIGYKIIRTTELVTDILKNTVRAVVGR